MRTIQSTIAIFALLLSACDDGKEPPNNSGNSTADATNTTADTASSSDTSSSSDASSSGTTVTVTSYVLEDDGSYTEKGTPLVFEVGVACQTWSRIAPEGDDVNPEPNHLHYNAATDVAFDGTTLTWTEFGPEHEDGAVGPLCEAGTGGEPKTATTDDYTAATNSPQNKAYVKVTKVE